MKKEIKRIVSVFLTVIMLLTGSVFCGANEAPAADNSGIIFASNAINGLLNAVFMGVSALFPKNFDTVEEYYANGSADFYSGTEVFLDEPAEGAKWHIGFGKASMVPENLADGSR